jgi:hypothetical protein
MTVLDPALRRVAPWMYAVDPRITTWLLLVLTIGVMTWAGRHFYTHAWSAFKHHAADMNTLVAVGTGAAFLYSVLATVAPDFFVRRGVAPDVYYEAVILIIALILTGNLFGRISETAQAARRGDLQFSHDLLRLDLANLGQSFQQCGDFHLAEDLVGLGIFEHLLKIGAAALESLLEFRSDLASGGGLFQRGRALLISQLGKGHGFLRLITIIVMPGPGSLASAADRTQTFRRNLTRPPLHGGEPAAQGCPQDAPNHPVANPAGPVAGRRTPPPPSQKQHSSRAFRSRT